MPTENDPKRTKIEDLPAPEEELGEEEGAQVRGGVFLPLDSPPSGPPSSVPGDPFGPPRPPSPPPTGALTVPGRENA